MHAIDALGQAIESVDHRLERSLARRRRRDEIAPREADDRDAEERTLRSTKAQTKILDAREDR